MPMATAIVAKTYSSVSGLEEVSFRRLESELTAPQKTPVTGSRASRRWARSVTTCAARPSSGTAPATGARVRPRRAVGDAGCAGPSGPRTRARHRGNRRPGGSERAPASARLVWRARGCRRSRAPSLASRCRGRAPTSTGSRAIRTRRRRPGAFLFHLQMSQPRRSPPWCWAGELGRPVCERLLDCGGVEGDLDHLPVALVQVVELIEPVVEPVLDRDSPHAGLRGDVRVDDRRAPLHEPGRVAGVDTARPEGMHREVEVVVGPEPGEIRRGRGGGELVALREAPAGSQAHELHVGAAERDADRSEPVLLALPRAGRVGVSLCTTDRARSADEFPFGRGLRSGYRGVAARATADSATSKRLPIRVMTPVACRANPEREVDSHMAGLMSRTSNVVRAWISKLLDRAEDPSVTLDYSYEKQLEMLQNVKRGVADVVTAKKRSSCRRRSSSRSSRSSTTRRARRSPRPRPPRAALERKTIAQQQLQGLDQQITGLESQQDKLLANEKRLSAKVEAFRARRRSSRRSTRPPRRR